jgi:hypothetical protein
MYFELELIDQLNAELRSPTPCSNLQTKQGSIILSRSSHIVVKRRDRCIDMLRICIDMLRIKQTN